ncbi:MAG TPA: heme ABC exporter ATP-binding protein CcmA [Rickettsia endosymbiont of Pyrocoelia pectoralis]|nr:heme ABC exporter ATP-binding protein CcmA [Rickettsia endosymbiont of Pyrocoelia pectoralis]
MLSLHKLQFKDLFNLSLTFLPSSITYIKGANGCGKTSLLRMIAGITQPSSGNIYYKNVDINNIPKPYCTYIGHNLGLKLEMTVFENLKFWSEIYNSLETLEAAIHYFKLHEILDEKCYNLSKGMHKMVAAARLIACQSNLWLLDEIETNLSKENRDLLNNLIAMKANSGGIILLSSHLENAIKSAQILQLD